MLRLSLVILMIALYPAALLAQTPVVRDFGDIADSVRVQTSLVSVLVTAAAFVIGVGLVMRGLFFVRQGSVSSDPTGKHVHAGLVHIAIGAMMVALPALTMTGVLTIFGSGDGVVDAYGQGVDVIPFGH